MFCHYRLLTFRAQLYKWLEPCWRSEEGGRGILQVSAAADSPPSDTHPYDATSKTTLTLYTGEWTVFFLIETGIFNAVVPRLIRLVPAKKKTC